MQFGRKQLDPVGWSPIACQGPPNGACEGPRILEIPTGPLPRFAEVGCIPTGPLPRMLEIAVFEIASERPPVLSLVGGKGSGQCVRQ